MRLFTTTAQLLLSLSLSASSSALPLESAQQPMLTHARDNSTITPSLFLELEELARLVDISYCVGGSGIQKPFQCSSRCHDFPDFELVKSWSTGPLLSDSCGYIALDHRAKDPRLVVAFRGTYSIANTIIDLSTNKQAYDPYPGAEDGDGDGDDGVKDIAKCSECAVHTGFSRSWQHTREAILSDIESTVAAYPTYRLTLVGHSLGGAIALMAALEFQARGWKPQVTTFGEPKVGNAAFVQYVDHLLVQNSTNNYRRITHLDDPVPLLPMTEWGYRPHAGEIYISKAALPPDVKDVQICQGDNDSTCSAVKDASLFTPDASHGESLVSGEGRTDEQDRRFHSLTKMWDFPARLKLWQLFFAHRDYFWRLGVCMSGGDPWDWDGKYSETNIS